MTILLPFHTRHFRDLKSFYLCYICQHMKREFPHRLSYNRFVERQTLVCLTCCSSSKHAHLASAPSYPSSIPHLLRHATSSVRNSIGRRMDGQPKGSAQWAGSTALSYIWSSTTGGGGDYPVAANSGQCR